MLQIHKPNLLSLLTGIALLFVNSADGLNSNLYSNQKLVIISCTAKCGSSTLRTSFAKSGFETIRRHTLYQELIDYALVRSKRANVLFIDSFRDPLSRIISRYFHHLSEYIGMSPEEIELKYQREGLYFINDIFKNFKDHLTDPDDGYAFTYWKVFNYDCLNDSKFDLKKNIS